MRIAITLSFILLCLVNTSLAQTPVGETPVPAASPVGNPAEVKPATEIQTTSAPSSTAEDPEVKSAADSPAARYARKDAPVRIPRLEAPPVIDGHLDDAVWRTAAVFSDFLQTQPGDNVKPTHPTEVRVGYDSKNFYLSFNAKQPRDKIRATIARRDAIFDDDYVLVHLDTFNDQRQAYLLFFSPLGIQADGTFSEERGEEYSLDIVMESKGVLTEDGYTIEVAIPFKSLRYEAGKNKQWGFHINRRVKYNNNEYNSWMPTNRSVSGWLTQAGRITGLEGIETTRQLEVIPSLTLSEAGRRTRYTFDGDPAGRYVNDGVKSDFGVTAKFSLSPTVTLDFAYNPDFAQVEADAPVTTANQRFPIFFPEKRPFSWSVSTSSRAASTSSTRAPSWTPTWPSSSRAGAGVTPSACSTPPTTSPATSRRTSARICSSANWNDRKTRLSPAASSASWTRTRTSPSCASSATWAASTTSASSPRATTSSSATTTRSASTGGSG